MKKGGKHQSPAGQEASHLPHKSPRGAHIREANGGYIMSAHGGDGDGMGADHVAPDMASIMAKLQSHMGGGGVAESGEVPQSPQDDEEIAEQAAAVKAPPVRKPEKKGKKSKIRLRDKSETY